MSTYRESDVEIPPGLPLGPAQIAAAYDFVPRDIGELPFGGDDLITRSLWLVRVGEWGIYTTVGHETGPWAFFTAGPDGARELAFGE